MKMHHQIFKKVRSVFFPQFFSAMSFAKILAIFQHNSTFNLPCIFLLLHKQRYLYKIDMEGSKNNILDVYGNRIIFQLI